MSHFTFNIADYRPLSAVRPHRAAHDRTPALKGPKGFVVLGSEPREQFEWLDPRPSVVDIRSLREGHQMAQMLCPPRAKVLRFLSQASDRVCTMPVHSSNSQSDDDPDPTAA